MRILFSIILITCRGLSSASDTPMFERDVRPILKAHCFHCHGEEEVTKGGLDLRLKHFLVSHGAVIPGNPEESELLSMLKSGEMPDGQGKLPDEEIELIERWIAAGAQNLRPEPETIQGHYLTEEERAWWSLQPIRRPKVPAGEGTEMDRLVGAKLKAAGLAPSPAADPVTLIRRAYFDLIGLPPTPGEVSAFVAECEKADEVADPFRSLVDRLLVRPEYGERWGRHWLDVAGYADSEGFDVTDVDRPSAWRYRDYVIRALNSDMPFDRFITEQLAGDELIPYPSRSGEPRELSPEEIEKLAATGFLRMAPDGTSGSKDPVARNAVITETVKIVSSSLLGMTVGCAECHDHRFDPILQEDFYRLRAIVEPGLNFAGWFSPSQRLVSLRTEADTAKEEELKGELQSLKEAYQEKLDQYQDWTLDTELQAIAENKREFARQAALKWLEDRDAGLSPEEKKFLDDFPVLKIRATEQQLNLFLNRHPDKYKEFKADVDQYKKDVAAINSRMPKIGSVRALTEVPKRPLPKTNLLLRGDLDSPGKEVAPGDLMVLDQLLDVDIPINNADLPTSGRRLAFARHLTSGKHPLFARVLVNRFWMHHFGRGLVDTPGDFGTQGEKPSHPELLDWLASEFTDGGWSLKDFHRKVMNTHTYRQSSRSHHEGNAVDAANMLLWRMNIRRLEAETIRDATLAVTGKLNPKRFGEPVGVAEDPNAQVIVGSTGDGEEYRRSIYVKQKRTQQPYQLAVFDAPEMEPNCESRNRSTVAPQSLLLMNSGFILEQSEAFAKRILSETDSKDHGSLISHAWRLAFGTSPDPSLVREAQTYLEAQADAFAEEKDPDLKALASFCQTLLASNPFLYIE